MNDTKDAAYTGWTIVQYNTYNKDKLGWLKAHAIDWAWGAGYFYIKDPEVAIMFKLKFPE
jgi:hypothetical protein